MLDSGICFWFGRDRSHVRKQQMEFYVKSSGTKNNNMKTKERRHK